MCNNNNNDDNGDNNNNEDDDDDNNNNNNNDGDDNINMMIMMMMIALKGALQDLYNLLAALRTVSNTYAQVARAQSCANHVQHIGRLLCATCHLPRGTKGQFSF